MAIDPQFVGLLQLLLGIVSLFFLKPAYDNRETPGSWSFAALCVGIGVYAFSAGLDWFVFDYGLSHLVFTFRSLGGVLITTAWLVFALDVTGRVTATRRLWAGAATYVVAAQLFIWADPLHHLVVAPETVMDGANFDPNVGVGLWALLGVGYLVTFVGTGLLAADALRSTGIRRRQLAVLALAILPTVAGSLTSVSDVTQYDYTSLGYALTASMFVWALFSGRFLDLTPVARRTALGEMSDAVVTLDDQNRVVDCNRRARELFDAGDDYVGLQVTAFFPSVVAELEAFADVAETETELELRLDGRERHFSLSVSPVTRRGQRGRVVVLRDITDQKRREQELRRQNERLDRFASMVGHDLRNPLTVAAGQLALARDDSESDAVAERLGKVERSHDRMEAMVDDLLTLARSGQRVEETEPVDLATLARNAWAQTETGGCELDLSMAGEPRIAADRGRLLHVFENCFRNAGAHNERSPTVRVGLVDDTAPDRADFFIEDDGDGIPAAERDHIFEHGYSTGDEGTGLGLSIVRDIVDAHGWRIRVTESRDGGARFGVTGVRRTDR